MKRLTIWQSAVTGMHCSHRSLVLFLRAPHKLMHYAVGHPVFHRSEVVSRKPGQVGRTLHGFRRRWLEVRTYSPSVPPRNSRPPSSSRRAFGWVGVLVVAGSVPPRGRPGTRAGSTGFGVRVTELLIVGRGERGQGPGSPNVLVQVSPLASRSALAPIDPLNALAPASGLSVIRRQRPWCSPNGFWGFPSRCPDRHVGHHSPGPSGGNGHADGRLRPSRQRPAVPV